MADDLLEQFRATSLPPEDEDDEERRLLEEFRSGPTPKKEAVEEGDRPSKLDSLWEGAKQGLTLGWADEAAAKLGSLFTTEADRLSAEATGRPMEDIYESQRDAYREQAQEARKANPGAYLGGELLGSMALPVGGAGGGLARAAGRAAIEGGIAGAGASSQEGGAVGDALFGAATGAGVSTGLRGIMGIGNQLSKRRIQTELGSGEGFTPIHMTGEEGRLADVYRNTIGRSIGGKRVLQDQERRFVEAAEEGLEQAKASDRALKRSLKERPKAADLPETRSIEREAARAQAKEGVSQAIIDTPAGQRLWNDIESDKFNTEEVATRLRELWKDKGFKEIKTRKFDVDDELVGILKNHFPDDDVKEKLRRNITGDRLMDIRNNFRITANKPKADMKGAQARKYAEEIDDWMVKQMGGPKSPEAQRFKDELRSWGEYQAYRRGLKGMEEEGRFNVKKLAKGRGEEGGDFGQKRARDANKALKKAVEQDKMSRHDIAELSRNNLEAAKAEGRRVAQLATAENPTGLSELLTTRMMAPPVPGLGNMALQTIMGAGVGRGLSSQGAQRVLAGQHGIQQGMQRLGNSERMRLIAELMRRGMSREAAMATTREE